MKADELKCLLTQCGYDTPAPSHIAQKWQDVTSPSNSLSMQGLLHKFFLVSNIKKGLKMMLCSTSFLRLKRTL